MESWVLVVLLLVSIVLNALLYSWLRKQQKISDDLKRESEETQALLAESKKQQRQLELVEPKQPITLVVMRHGTRMDDVNKEWEKTAARVYDPPATNLEFAAFTADELRSLGIKTIISSPFIRCIQTAAAMAKYLGVNEIQINHTIGEVLTLKNVPTQPVFLNPSDLEPFINEAAPDHTVTINQSRSVTTPMAWPETLVQARARFTQAFSTLAQSSQGNTLVVSHGDAVVRFAALTQRKNDEDFYSVEYFGYASAQATIKDGRVSWAQPSVSQVLSL